MNLRHIFIFSVVFFIAQFSSVRSNFLPASNHFPFSGSEPISKYTPAPINIVTKNATFVFTKPFMIDGAVIERWLLKNTGQSVDVTVDQPFTVGRATGGVLYNDVYIFHVFRFYWYNNATNGDYSATTVNGKHGTQLEAIAYLYNEKYGSFQNALKHPDGLVATSFRVILSTIPNPFFVPFQYYMQKIKKPGDSTPILSSSAFIWNNINPPNTVYYAYPGSYTSEKTGEKYFCTTNIIFPLSPFNFISHEQFRDTFGQLLDRSGKSLTNVATQYPAGSRPVLKSAGFILNPIFA